MTPFDATAIAGGLPLLGPVSPTQAGADQLRPPSLVRTTSIQPGLFFAWSPISRRRSATTHSFGERTATAGMTARNGSERGTSQPPKLKLAPWSVVRARKTLSVTTLSPSPFAGRAESKTVHVLELSTT